VRDGGVRHVPARAPRVPNGSVWRVKWRDGFVTLPFAHGSCNHESVAPVSAAVQCSFDGVRDVAWSCRACNRRGPSKQQRLLSGTSLNKKVKGGRQAFITQKEGVRPVYV